MNDENVAYMGGCGYQTGIIFIRRCGNPSVNQCAQCGLPLCIEHAKPYDASVGTNLTDFGGNADPASPFQSLGEDIGLTGLGAGLGFVTPGRAVHCPTCLASLAGQGMTGDDDWQTTDGIDYGDGNLSFTDEDYAAFDEISGFDKNSDLSRGFDS